MKKTITKKIKLLGLMLMLFQFLNAQDADRKTQVLTQVLQNTKAIFEGKVIRKNDCFYGTNKGIYSSFTVEIDKVVYGEIKKGTIEIIVQGGIIGNDESAVSDGMFMSLDCRGTFFVQDFEFGSSQKQLTNANSFSLVQQVCLNGDNVINNGGLSRYYKTSFEMYNDISKKITITIPEKKSQNQVSAKEINKEELNTPTINIIPIINYNKRQENIKNLNAVKKSIHNNSTQGTTATNDLTAQIANGTFTSAGGHRYFEFDVNIKANNNITFFDNLPVELSYNTAVFGTNLVANNKVYVVSGPSFDTNTTYLNPNTYSQDLSTNSIGITCGSDPNKNHTFNRVNVTTTYVKLCHVQLQLSNCGQAVNINLINQSSAVNLALFTLTANDTTQFGNSYDNLFYNGSLTNNVVCHPTINNFNTPIDGGIGNLFQIHGYGFGSARGNGQVKFKNADLGNGRINKLNTLDYNYWSDTLIKIKMPSRVDSTGNIYLNTPGSGRFILRNNANDSTFGIYNQAGDSLQIEYSIRTTATNTNSAINKLPANLIKRNSIGGYTIRLDTSISHHPLILGCVKKAVATWRCLTAVNLIFGTDTTLQNDATLDGVTTIFMNGGLISADYGAQTTNRPTTCGGVAVITEFDIRCLKTANWFFDTTGAPLPANKVDFLEVITHEIGHGIGLCHVADTTQIMFYEQMPQSTTLAGNQRKTLQIGSFDADGGTHQVSFSVTNVTGACGYTDMTPAQGSSCNITGIENVLRKNISINVFPNPTNGNIINVNCTSSNKEYVIYIYDVMGRTVYSENIRTNVSDTQSFDISKLPNGVYLISLVVGNEKSTLKFIKN